MKKRLTALTAACLMALCLSAPVSAASPAAGTVATSSTGLNVRSAPSSTASVRTSLPKGTAVTLISRSGDWWQVQYGPDSYGYCSAAYIRELSGSSSAVVSTASGSLNVRSAASSSAAIQTSLPKGAAVTVLSTSGSWSRILYHGARTGYVRSDYLSAGAAVSLNVPSYKQTDARWASVTLGSSGQTIGRIGCTTTALAMTESYDHPGGHEPPPFLHLRRCPLLALQLPAHRRRDQRFGHHPRPPPEGHAGDLWGQDLRGPAALGGGQRL